MLAKQDVAHLDSPLHGHVQDRTTRRCRAHRRGIGCAFRVFLEEPGEGDAGVKHQQTDVALEQMNYLVEGVIGKV